MDLAVVNTKDISPLNEQWIKHTSKELKIETTQTTQKFCNIEKGGYLF